MSLDVYLRSPKPVVVKAGSGIFVRENGQRMEISRAEWDEKFPGREPVVVEEDEDYESNTLFSRNMTHNLGAMANEAGIYKHLWRPEEIGITHARQLIDPLRVALERLRAEPEHYKTFNPSNGWGNYEVLVDFVESYLNACVEYPDAEVYASR